MDDKSFHFRIPKKWVRVSLIVATTALVVAPLTAIASHTFTDVSDSNTFHTDIDWLASAGITKGCNPPTNDQFCPNDSVTRGQMSAFMRRFAQFIDAEDGTPGQADNASNLGGKSPSAYETTLDGLVDQGGLVRNIAIGGGAAVLEKTLPSAAGDYALLTYGVSAWDASGATNRYWIWLQADNSTCNYLTSHLPGSVAAASTTAFEATSMYASFLISTAGDPTVTLCATSLGAADTMEAQLNSIHTDNGSSVVVSGASGSGLDDFASGN